MEQILLLNTEIRKIFAFLSHFPVYGSITLGPLLHFFVGLIITAVGRKYKFSFSKVFLTVFLIALAKEFYDSFTLENSMKKHIFDIVITISPVMLIKMWCLLLKRPF